MFSYHYSSEVGAWSEKASLPHPGCGINLLPSALVGNALYFLGWTWKAILEKMSVIRVPPSDSFMRIMLITTEHAGMGLAAVVNSKLCLWSREVGSDSENDAGWVESRVIELKTLFPAKVLSAPLYLAGFAEGVDIVFVRTRRELFTIDLKSVRVTKTKHWEQPRHVRDEKWKSLYNT
ncbi:hypothetical protein EJB05_13818, partial [Eragrostis curvula]